MRHISDEQCRTALTALENDSLYGAYDNGSYFVRDVRRQRTIHTCSTWREMMERLRIERMRLAIKAALECTT